ncbi:MAG TPA: nucleotidyltransferase family protein [Syntrophobacteraceae bacterium]|nr:nucleotidyltransferase family protein [Syntrophobacteraceae bacterium]
MMLPESQLTSAGRQLASQVSPESLLQILAAGINPDSDDTAEMEALLRGQINWDTVIADSGILGVQPLLYRHLSQDRLSPYVPQAVLDCLKDAYRKTAMGNLRFCGFAERLLRVFEEARLRVVLLKGAFLANWIYRDIALRPMDDIDILCRREDDRQIRAKLAELGFHQKTVHPSSFHEAFFAVDKGDHLNPFYGSKPLMVEVHFSIFPNVPHGFQHMDEVWERTVRVPPPTGGPPVTSLAPADLLLYLCLHLQRHLRYGQCRLYWFCDIHEVIAHYRDAIEWGELFAMAERLAVAEQVKPVLSLLRRFWRSRVPEMEAPVEELDLADLLRKPVVTNREKSQEAVIRGQLYKLGMLGELPGWRNRAYYLWKLLFPSRENVISRYRPRSAPALWLCRLLHPLVLVKRAVVSLFHNVLSFMRK